MLVDKHLELCDHVPMPTEGEIGVDPHLRRREPQLLEAGDGCLGKVVVRELDQRGPSPQSERASQPLGGILGRDIDRLAHELLEPAQVELRVAHPEHVAGRLRDDRIAPLPERLPQLGDAHP